MLFDTSKICIFSAIPHTLLIAFIVLAIIAFLSSFLSDFINLLAIFATALTIIIFYCLHKTEAMSLLANIAKENNELKGVISFSGMIFAAFFAVVGFLRGTPLIWAWKERHVALIFGTLFEAMDYRAGFGVSLGYAGLFGVIGYVCINSAVEKMSFIIFLAPAIVVAAVCVITLIFSLCLK